MDTFCDQYKIALSVTLSMTLMLVLATSGMARQSYGDQSLSMDDNSFVNQPSEQQAKKSLLSIFRLDESRNGARSDVMREQRSAQLKLNEDLSSEAIPTPSSTEIDSVGEQQLSMMDDDTVMDDDTAQRSQPRSETSKLIKSKLLNRDAQSFASPTPSPVAPMGKLPDSVYEPVRQSSESEDRYQSNVPESYGKDFGDAYTDDLPATTAERQGAVNEIQQHRNSMPGQIQRPQSWRRQTDRPAVSSSVSAIMNPRIRHTENGIEVNFSDSETGHSPTRPESLLENMPTAYPGIQDNQQSDNQDDPNLRDENRQQDDQQVPDWDSILGDDRPADPDSDIQNVESESDVVDSVDDALDETAADVEIRSAAEIQSIEKQREGYRSALRERLSMAPAQRIFLYLDDAGEQLPASDTQKFYLLQFNSYRYSRLYNNQCRFDRMGNSWCPMHAVWQTPNLCYHPLYFEEVNLERFGGRFPYVQPVISAAHFFSNVVTLPYAMGMQPPHCCYYSAGFGRPGNKYCYLMERPVWSLRGATLQSLLATGMVFGLP